MGDNYVVASFQIIIDNPDMGTVVVTDSYGNTINITQTSAYGWGGELNAA